MFFGDFLGLLKNTAFCFTNILLSCNYITVSLIYANLILTLKMYLYTSIGNREKFWKLQQFIILGAVFHGYF